jgi:hypothetical protein
MYCTSSRTHAKASAQRTSKAPCEEARPCLGVRTLEPVEAHLPVAKAFSLHASPSNLVNLIFTQTISHQTIINRMCRSLTLGLLLALVATCHGQTNSLNSKFGQASVAKPAPKDPVRFCQRKDGGVCGPASTCMSHTCRCRLSSSPRKRGRAAKGRGRWSSSLIVGVRGGAIRKGLQIVGGGVAFL